MKISLDKYHPHKLIKSVAKQINTVSELDGLEQIIQLTGAHGKGKIAAFEFSDGLSLLVFDCNLNEAWELEFINARPAPIQFNFSLSGKIHHRFDRGEIQYDLNALQGSITASPKDCTQIFAFPANEKITFASVMIDRAKFLKKIDGVLDKMPEDLAKLFVDTEASQPFIFRNNYSLTSAGIINQIVASCKYGYLRSPFIEAKSLELVTRYIKQYNINLEKPAKHPMLREYDVEKIKEAREFLVSNLKNDITIEALSKKVGINQQKLKTGFKIIYDATIGRYLRNERVKHASKLLKDGYTVKDASREVGYANQSRFAQRFKEKYGVLPKDYIKSVRERG